MAALGTANVNVRLRPKFKTMVVLAKNRFGIRCHEKHQGREHAGHNVWKTPPAICNSSVKTAPLSSPRGSGPGSMRYTKCLSLFKQACSMTVLWHLLITQAKVAMACTATRPSSLSSSRRLFSYARHGLSARAFGGHEKTERNVCSLCFA